MNTEIIKAMNKKENKPNALKKWWKKNRLTVLRIVLFPIYFTELAIDKAKKISADRNPWSEERANEIFNYYIPRRSDWVEDEKLFFFFDNGYGWNINLAKKYLKRKDRKFWELHNGFWGGNLREYLIDKFELEGFTKKVVNTCDSQTEIVFRMNENADV